MNFSLQLTTGAEVALAGFPKPTQHYGSAPATGLWRVDLNAFESYVAGKFETVSFGESVDHFIFGFELADLKGWGDYFTSMADYASYRPKMKAIVSVGQVDWLRVKDAPVEVQYAQLAAALRLAASRIGGMKKKPRKFDFIEFDRHIAIILASAQADMFSHA
jgi:hypothetical protein